MKNCNGIIFHLVLSSHFKPIFLLVKSEYEDAGLLLSFNPFGFKVQKAFQAMAPNGTRVRLLSPIGDFSI